MSFVKFPSIEQLRGAVKEIEYHYKDTDHPSIDFIGTVKLHGTNASVGWDGKSAFQIQSRNRIITAKNDNVGFAKFVLEHQGVFERILNDIRLHNPPPETETDPMLFIYGEWCGKGIQSGVAISSLDKMFVIFAAAYHINDGTCWINYNTIPPIDSVKIYDVNQFKKFNMTITFTPEGLKQAQPQLEQLTMQVENECPVGKHFGISGIGEGIVWVGKFNSPRDCKTHYIRFKVKGDKHSVVKAKTSAPIDTDKLEGVEKFIEYAVTDNRMMQGYDELFTKPGLNASLSDVGKFIKWVRDDVLKEESDTMTSNDINVKDINKPLSDYVRNWFIKMINR